MFLENLFNSFINSVIEDAPCDVECDSYSESVVNGQRRITYEFSGESDHERIKSAIVNSMKRFKGFDNSDGKVESFIITFVFNGNDMFHFTWNDDEKRFLTEDPDGSVFYYNFEDGTIVSCDPVCNENSNNIDEGQDDCCRDSSDSDDIEENGDCIEDKKDILLQKNANLAEAIKHKVELYNNDGEDTCDGCEVFFCPEKAVDVFLENIESDANYLSVFDEGRLVGLMCDVIELIPEETDLPEEMSNIDIYDAIYHNESDLLDTFCEKFTEDYGFTKCHWDAEKDDDGHISSISVTWIF